MNKRQIICLFLSVIMLLAVAFPVSVFADEIELIDEAAVEEPAEIQDPIDEEIITDEPATEEPAAPVAEQDQDVLLEEETDKETTPVIVTTDPEAEIEEEETLEDGLVGEDSDTFNASSLIVITTQPVSVEAKTGAAVTFSVKATGVKTYAWQYRTSSTGSWKAMYSSATGANTATLKTEATDARYAYEYRCKMTDKNGEVLSSDIVKIVKPGTFAIVMQPVDVEAKVNDAVTFSVGAVGVKTYAWQYRTSSTGSWKAMYSSATGANTATLKTEATKARYGYEYSCLLTSSKGATLRTDIVRIVDPTAGKAVIETQPVNVTANVGDSVTFTVKASNVKTFAWQYRTSSAGSWKAMYSSATGANTATLKTSATEARYGYEYSCLLTGEDDQPLRTDVVKIVKPAGFVVNNVTYYIISSTTVGVSKYTGSSASVTIPETVKGYTVVEIGQGAFMGNNTLQSIDLPDSITVIKARAFKDCTSLREMK